jgi:hypothetical protein
MASSIQLLRSNNAQERPFPGNLLDGQPAINTNSQEPGLFFKASDGSIVKVGPATVTSDGNPPNANGAGQLGNTVGELWLDKSSSAPVLKVYDGAQWVDAAGPGGGGPVDGSNLIDGTVTSAKIADGTIVNADISPNASITPDKLTFIQPGAGATQRTVENKLQDAVSAKDFGAAGDGVTDDTAAIQAALEAAGVGGKTLFVPSGRYRISYTLIIPTGVRVLGSGKYDHWNRAEYGNTGTVFATTGTGNPQRWTDIDGSDPADDTPMFVAGGNAVYLEDVTLITGESTNPKWSIGIFYPCVKQCGFVRLQAFNFTDAPVYLDATWSDRNTVMKTLHPEVATSTGMTEFYGSDFLLSGDTHGIKVQGTTRDPSGYAEDALTWIWGWGGASDVVFDKGRTTGISIDGAVANAAGALQGLRFVNVDVRLGSVRDTVFNFGRANRVLIIGGYSEGTMAGIKALFTTNSTAIVFIGGRWRGTDVWLNGVNQGFSLNPGSGRTLGGQLTFFDWEGQFMNSACHIGTGSIAPHADGTGGLGTSTLNWSLVRTKSVRNDTSDLNLRGNTSVSFSAGGSASRASVSTSAFSVFPNQTNIRLSVTNAAVTFDTVTRPAVDNTHTLGDASFRWDQLFAANATINTSDVRCKQDIDLIEDKILDTWGKIEWVKYRWIDRVELKGENARSHFGLIAQHIKTVFESDGLNPFEYGILCFDSWPEQPEEVEEVEAEYDENQNLIQESFTRIITPFRAAGDVYGIRYEQAFALEAAYQRRELKRLKEANSP